MKIAGVSLWIWGIGLLVIGGAAMAVVTSTPAHKAISVQVSDPDPRSVPEKQGEGFDEMSLRFAEDDCLRDAKDVVSAEYQCVIKRLDLKEQVTAGKAQLKAIEFGEAKTEKVKAEEDYNASEKKLKDMESRMVKSLARGSRAIDTYLRVQLSFLSRMESRREYFGIRDEKGSACFQAYLDGMHVTTEQVKSGDYAKELTQ